MHTFSPSHDWWHTKLQEGKLLKHHDAWKSDVLVEELTADFLLHLKNWAQQNRRSSETQLGYFLRTACPGKSLRRWQGKETVNLNERIIHRPYYYGFPSLAELRKHWDDKFGGPYNWPPNPEDPTEKDPIPF
jgi:hypothetical protein